MAEPTPDAIIFAIKAALRLGHRPAAYIDSPQNRGLVLPLPDFDLSINATVAANFFYYERFDYRPTALVDEAKLAASARITRLWRAPAFMLNQAGLNRRRINRYQGMTLL